MCEITLSKLNQTLLWEPWVQYHCGKVQQRPSEFESIFSTVFHGFHAKFPPSCHDRTVMQLAIKSGCFYGLFRNHYLRYSLLWFALTLPPVISKTLAKPSFTSRQ